MVKLFIKTKGLLINIPGLPPFRTPAEVDISKTDPKRIEVELRKMGVNDFVIRYDNDEQTKKVKKKDKSIVKKIVEKIIGPTIIKETVDIDQINKRFDNIDELLSRIASKPVELHNILEHQKPEKVDDFETPDFIPTIDTSDIKMGGSTDYSRVEDEKEKDLDKKSKQLSKLTGKDGFKK